MNISIKNINDCENLNKEQIDKLADKLNISTSNSIINTCKDIKKQAYNINPCGFDLYDDTDIVFKKHQLIVSNYILNDNHRGMVLVHSVGTGKTLSSIACSQCLLINNKIKHVIVVTPTSLQNNFIGQLEMYGLNKKEINTSYTFYTIQGLYNAIENKTVYNPSNSLIIIDEAHNLRTVDSKRYDKIFKYTQKAKKIILLTATPLINYDHDIINLISLVRGDKPITIKQFEEIKENKKDLIKYMKDVFSFYTKNVENDPNFPNKTSKEIFFPMDKDYYNLYNKVENGQVSKIPVFSGKNIHVFYNGLRRASNILDGKSPKVDWIIDKIKSSSKKDKFVIFSHFINMGIYPVMEWLDKKKIKYKYISGDMNIHDRGIAVDAYNDSNDDTNILFITKAGAEGLDLKNTTNIIIMEPSWNENIIEQIIGRGVRYKSHANLPKSKQHVYIYKLYCIKPIENKNLNKITNKHMLDFNGDMMSVDMYLRNYSWTKQQELDKFLKLMDSIKIEKEVLY